MSHQRKHVPPAGNPMKAEVPPRMMAFRAKTEISANYVNRAARRAGNYRVKHGVRVAV